MVLNLGRKRSMAEGYSISDAIELEKQQKLEASATYTRKFSGEAQMKQFSNTLIHAYP